MTKHNQKGFSHIITVLFLVLVIAVIGFVFYRVVHTSSKPKTTASAQSATTKTSTQKTASAAPKLSPAPDLTKLPLGDGKVTTAGAQKGYVYSCTSNFKGGGAEHAGNWITGSTWNANDKLHVQGDVHWANASVNIQVQGAQRIITTNDLPTNHNTGSFPIARTDPAYQYDRNPNSIVPQSITARLDANPTMAASPSCTDLGAIGYMTNGVALYNALDAAGRDAAAHEIQDNCDGHPQGVGQYHYHSLSGCLKDISATTVMGFALDGYPITGPKVSDNSYYATTDLDECHGTTSSINLDGKTVNMYHYVMTDDYPYSIGCFKGTPIKVHP